MSLDRFDIEALKANFETSPEFTLAIMYFTYCVANSSSYEELRINVVQKAEETAKAFNDEMIPIITQINQLHAAEQEDPVADQWRELINKLFGKPPDD